MDNQQINEPITGEEELRNQELLDQEQMQDEDQIQSQSKQSHEKYPTEIFFEEDFSKILNIIKTQEKNNNIQIKDEKSKRIYDILSQFFEINLEQLIKFTIDNNTDRKIYDLIMETKKRQNPVYKSCSNSPTKKNFYGSQSFKYPWPFEKDTKIESLDQKDIGISGSSVLWVLQNLEIQKYLTGKEEVSEFENKLDWFPNDVDIFCFSMHKINLPVEFLEKYGYFLENHSRFNNNKKIRNFQFMEKEYSRHFIGPLDIDDFQYLLIDKQKEKTQKWEFSLFNFVNEEKGKKIQFIVKRDKKLNFDFPQLENFVSFEKPIFKPVYKILEINSQYFSSVNQKRIQKYQERGYQILPQKLVKYTIMRCVLLKKLFQEGNFPEKRFNDYIAEIIGDFLIINLKNELKEMVGKYCFFELVTRLGYFQQGKRVRDDHQIKINFGTILNQLQNGSKSYKNINKNDIPFQKVDVVDPEQQNKFSCSLISKDYWSEITQEDEKTENIIRSLSSYWGVYILKVLWETQKKFGLKCNEKIPINNIPFPLKLLFFMIY